MSFTESIRNILNKAVADCFAASGPAFDCQVTPCQDKKFGDYQSNLAFLLAKRERTSPRNIAQAVVESVQAEMAKTVAAGGGQDAVGGEQDAAGGEQGAAGGEQDAAGGEQGAADGGQKAVGGEQGAADGGQDAAGGEQVSYLSPVGSTGALIDSIEVAGAGFINIRIRDLAMLAELESSLSDPRCGVARTTLPQRIVIDYSSPNLAKDLHVGTMRSTVIGDSIARVLEFLGHVVLRQNHYGDWGANFGVLVAMIKQEYGSGLDELKAAPLEAVEELYAQGSRLKAGNGEFAARAAAEVNNLQSGNPESLAVWQVLMDKTLQNCHALYRAFNVSLDESHDCPESFYRDDLARVVSELEDKDLLVDDNNAKCAYLDGFYNVNGDPLPVIVRKSDAGYNYSTTDLAGVRHRVGRLQAQQIIIVTDRGQELHFRMLSALAQKAGWLPDAVQLRHLGYGVILQEIVEDGRRKKARFRTRSGGTVKIRELLDEGRRRSEKLTLEKNPDISRDELNDIAAKLSIAALKYADLKQRPESDYTFNWDQMLASQGNTGVYILYCYVRIASLFDKSGLDRDALAQSPGLMPVDEPAPLLTTAGAGSAEAGGAGPGAISLSHELERELLVQLVSFPELFSGYEEDLTSHDICHYLYELSVLYSRFWKDCPVLTAAEDVRRTRLVLSLAVAGRLKLGLSLLGIDVVERM